ncbi:hypothetical protein PAXRUDRAFT_22826 [Paxillus rubicundulus Ve08.2h10]|uniref:Uncharacterized protein n=1 Tax=Paxillus rubicundulus Ve08.2h10 TaxID=930991 RepID=A0A0D0BJF9_9AGAM|nr:hypothetical protein PAXRUDRAFT_22826 [Paxillus rubicundulus Ve08.2h10]
MSPSRQSCSSSNVDLLPFSIPKHRHLPIFYGRPSRELPSNDTITCYCQFIKDSRNILYVDNQTELTSPLFDAHRAFLQIHHLEFIVEHILSNNIPNCKFIHTTLHNVHIIQTQCLANVLHQLDFGDLILIVNNNSSSSPLLCHMQIILLLTQRPHRHLLLELVLIQLM